MEKYVEFKNVSKAYVGVQALRDIHFRVNSGEVCALLGENGAGKSTLLKVLSGDQLPDSGCCCINGEDMHFTSPVDALRNGISIIYQERQLGQGTDRNRKHFYGAIAHQETEYY